MIKSLLKITKVLRISAWKVQQRDVKGEPIVKIRMLEQRLRYSCWKKRGCVTFIKGVHRKEEREAFTGIGIKMFNVYGFFGGMQGIEIVFFCVQT